MVLANACKLFFFFLLLVIESAFFVFAVEVAYMVRQR